MLIKVCGLRNEENIKQTIELGVDFIGYNFYKSSPRFVSAEAGTSNSLKLQPVLKVGVFVDEDIEVVESTTKTYELDFVQLHGAEPYDYVARCLGFTNVIQVVGLDSREDILQMNVHQGVKYLLFDKKSPLFGGTGQKFDWEILNEYSGNIPFLLAGGIGPDDVEAVLKIDHAQFIGLDLNSKFEKGPANKDIGLLKSFLEDIRK